MNTLGAKASSSLETLSHFWTFVVPFVLAGVAAAFLLARLYHTLRYASLPVH